jgi:hypothetical protein
MRRYARATKGRQKQSRQQSDYRDNHEQLDEGKATFVVHWQLVLSSDSVTPYRVKFIAKYGRHWRLRVLNDEVIELLQLERDIHDRTMEY